MKARSLYGPELWFRSEQWQRGYKLGKDLWQAENFLEAEINDALNLIWYKDRDGVHEK